MAILIKMMNSQTRRWIVRGQVQGVAFRAYTVEKAKELNLLGWVRNLSTGEVEVLAQGNTNALDQLEVWLYQGAPAARVAEVISDRAPYQELSGFEKIPNASKPEHFEFFK
jgi:acylphosphatase